MVQVLRVTFLESLRSVKLVLWDEDSRRLVSFREAQAASQVGWERASDGPLPTGRITFRAQEGSGHMVTQERLLYVSENGDRWSLAREPRTGQVVIRHRANLSSGGQMSDIRIGAFLVQGGLGPERQELLRLIGSLIDGARDDGSSSTSA